MRSALTDTLIALTTIIFITHTVSLPVQNTDGVKAASGSEVSDEVKQLESLKNSGAKNVAVVKSESKSITSVNGKEKSVTHKEEKVENTKTGEVIVDVKQEIVQSNEGKPETVVKTKVDIPAEGVHKTIVNENGKTTAVDNNEQTEESQERPKVEEYYTGIDGVEYSPWDVARYVFKTGDKEGLRLALRQLISQGFMSRDDAEAYMKEIERDLDFLWARYEEETKTNNAYQMLKQVQVLQDALGPITDETAAQDEIIDAMERSNINNINKLPALDDYARSKIAIDKKSSHHPTEPEESPSVESLEDLSFLGDLADFDSFLEKLKMADYLARYYSAKPDYVIYQLSKAMFQQSITEGNEEATQALRKFSNFLEREVSENKLSEELEERVLDIMTEAFHDTISENPQIQVLERLMDQQGPQVGDIEDANQGRNSQIKNIDHEQSFIPKTKPVKSTIKPQSKPKPEKENEIVKQLQESPKPNPEATQALANAAVKQEAVTSKKTA